MKSLKLAAICQIVPLIALILVQEIFTALTQNRIPMLVFASIHGICAALLSLRLEMASWWFFIHLFFLPVAFVFVFFTSQEVMISPWTWPVLFLVALLFNWNALKERVPLYLTSPWTLKRVLTLLPEGSHDGTPFKFIDLGCGLAGPLVALANERKSFEFVGVETAPLSFLISWIRSIPVGNLKIRYQSIWNVDLSEYDFVYAFLSPAPMPRLWKKVKSEMRPGSTFISNTFKIPGQQANRSIEIGDLRDTQIHVFNR